MSPTGYFPAVGDGSTIVAMGRAFFPKEEAEFEVLDTGCSPQYFVLLVGGRGLLIVKANWMA